MLSSKPVLSSVPPALSSQSPSPMYAHIWDGIGRIGPFNWLLFSNLMSANSIGSAFRSLYPLPYLTVLWCPGLGEAGEFSVGIAAFPFMPSDFISFFVYHKEPPYLECFRFISTLSFFSIDRYSAFYSRKCSASSARSHIYLFCSKIFCLLSLSQIVHGRSSWKQEI